MTTTDAPGTVAVTVGPGVDPAGLWAAIHRAASAGGLGTMAAARLAVAAIGLVGDAGGPAVVEVATVPDPDGARIEAVVRDGAGTTGSLPPGLVDICSERLYAAGQVEQVVAVRADPAEPGLDAFREAGGRPFDPLRLLGTALVVLRGQQAQIVAGEAETLEFRAELDETNQGLLAVYAELEAANRRIADLLAMLSHDIRQPLGIITCYASLLLDGWDQLDDAARRRDVARIATAGTGMTQLVEEILTLTQLDAAGLAIRSAPIELSIAVADAVAGVYGLARDTVTVHDEGNLRVLADPRHLHQILTNLLSNAVKYGSPPVEITMASAGEAVDIRVRDHGDGVPADFLPRLFDRFARADTPACRDKKGTGLGLYIVRQLVDANGGSIVYRDHPGGGGCFSVRLPAAEPSAAQPV